MNTRQLLAVATAAIAFVGTGAVVAQEVQLEVPPSTLTRAEVKAELARAVSSGAYATDEASYTVQAAASTQSRAEVVAEAPAVDPLDVQLYLGE